MVHKLASQQSRIFGICCFLLRKMRDPKMRLWMNHPKHQPFSTSHISGAALSPTHNRSQPTPSSHIMSSWSSGRSDDDPYGQNMDDFHQENHWLVVWNIFYFSIYIYIILGIIIPTDFHIFQRGSNHQPDQCLIHCLVVWRELRN